MTAHAMFSTIASVSPPHGLDRKMKKPLMEKRRRARINHCLAELKSILLAVTPAGANAHPTKLEKADILEMTVQYLQGITSMKSSNDVALAKQKFAEGYSNCAQTAFQFLTSISGPSESRLNQGLMNHLSRDLSMRMDPSICSPSGVCPPAPITDQMAVCQTSYLVGHTAVCQASQQQPPISVLKPQPVKASLLHNNATVSYNGSEEQRSAELRIRIPNASNFVCKNGAKVKAEVSHPQSLPESEQARCRQQLELPTPPFRLPLKSNSSINGLDWNRLNFSPSSGSRCETSSLSPFSSQGSMSPTTPASPRKASSVWRPW